MKKINPSPSLLVLCLSMSLAAVSAHAEDLTAATDSNSNELFEQNRIDALHFRSAAHVREFSLSLSTSFQDSSFRTQAGVEFNKGADALTSASATFSYGFTDNLLVAIGFTDQLSDSNTNTDEIQGTTNNYSYLGLSDPNFHLNYRLWGGLEGHQFLSIAFDLSPSMGSRQLATSTSPGNMLRGGQYTNIGINYYHVIHHCEFMAGVNYQTYSVSNQNAVNNTYSSTNDNYNRVYFGGTYRLHFMDNEFFDLFANLDLPYNTIFTQYNQNPVYQSSIHHGMEVFPGIKWGRRMNSDSLVSLSYTYSSYATQTNPIAGASDYDQILNQYHQQFLALGYSVLF